MNMNASLSTSIDKELPPKLAAPAPAFGGLENTVIDDILIDALTNSPGIPFTVPFYSNVAPGDTIVFIGNGRFAGFHQVSDTESRLGQPFTVYVPLSLFEFTGKLDLYYYQQDAFTQSNHAVSKNLILKVQRNNYPSPYMEGDQSLPAPVILPPLYNKQTFDSNTNVSITASYPAMAVGDTIQLVMEIRATTADRSVNFYYPDPSPSAQNVDQETAAKNFLQYTLPASSFKDIDESIARVFYTVYSNDTPWLQQRSLSTVFQVDVVPPFA